MKTRLPAARNHGFRIAGALVGPSVVLGACPPPDKTPASIPAVPLDYRARHPIAVHEANQSMVIFVGRGRGGLSASDRAEVMGLAQSWRHEATGPIVADVPIDTPNAAAAADAFHEAQSLLAGGGARRGRALV